VHHRLPLNAPAFSTSLPPIRYYLKSYTQKQINAFATCVLAYSFSVPFLLLTAFTSHASRYFELYHPSGSIEIAHTSRYSHRTGKSELCILATRPLAPGAVITELKGSMANLTAEEDKELKRTDLRNSDIRRDFSVIHSKQMKKNHLFLGPARFVNVSQFPSRCFR
jgi:histone-lysine N-methyltransferase SUV420H